MVSRYAPVRFPIEAYPLLRMKQQKIETTLRGMYPTRKIRAPLSKVLQAIMESEVIIDDAVLRQKFVRKRQ
jgi:hypothetical protein